MSKKPLYKVIFHNQGKVYEIYAHSVHQGAMFGFIEIEKLVFDDPSAVVVDPAQESLKSEFHEVSRTYIPLHAIIRIDEVNKRGIAKVFEPSKGENITPFPIYTPGNSEPDQA